MKAGLASVCINPGHKIWMAGYGRQPEPTDRAYQDLKAKALVLDDGTTRVAVITCDLLNFDEENVARFRGAVRRRTGIPEDRILLCPSHTHTAPGTCRIDMKDGDDICEDYLRDLDGWFGEVAGRALTGLEESRLSFGSARCEVGINRRLMVGGRVEMRPNPDGAVDHEAGLLKVCGPGGALRGVLMSYACHPTTYYSTEVGGDFAGFAQDALERDAPGLTAMFAQGCGGDVKPRSIGADGRFRADRREAAEGFGEDLARSVRAALDGGMSPVEGALSVAETWLCLPLEPPPDRDQALAALSSESWWVTRWGREILRRMDAGEALESHVPIRVTAVRIGDFALVAMGAEVFAETGVEIRRRLAPGRAMTVAYANGMAGYIATPQALLEGGYEPEVYTWWNVPSRFRPEAEGVLIEGAVALAKGAA